MKDSSPKKKRSAIQHESWRTQPEKKCSVCVLCVMVVGYVLVCGCCIFLRRRGKVKCNLLTCERIRNETRTRNGNNTQRRSRIAAHWTEDSFFQHLDGRSQPRKPHVVTWMTRFLRVNGHRSSELSLFLNIVVNGHVLTALLLSLLWSYSEFLFLRLGRSSSRDVRSTCRALTWRR